MSNTTSRALSSLAGSRAAFTVMRAPSSVSGVDPGAAESTLAISVVSMVSPLSLIPVPHQNRAQVHDEDQHHEHEDRRGREVLELGLRLLDVREDQRRQGRKPLLERGEDAA